MTKVKSIGWTNLLWKKVIFGVCGELWFFVVDFGGVLIWIALWLVAACLICFVSLRIHSQFRSQSSFIICLDAITRSTAPNQAKVEEVGFFENVPVFITSENEKRVVGRFDSVDHIASTSDQRVALDSNHSCKDVLLFSGGNYCSSLWQIWRGRPYFANCVLRKPSTSSSYNLVSRSLSYIGQLAS